MEGFYKGWCRANAEPFFQTSECAKVCSNRDDVPFNPSQESFLMAATQNSEPYCPVSCYSRISIVVAHIVLH